MTRSNASDQLPRRPTARGNLARIRRALTAGLDQFEERPVLAALLLGTLTVVAASCVGLLTGFPHPSVHDEFSYLLQADTFASGRLTNPTPAMWEHFESLHVIMQPTYASKYPPGQGLALAFGQVLGHPLIGVWLSVGLMVAAITWMLFAWLPARWAVVAGFIVAVHMGIGSYWAQSYWGGAVAATGGALVFGALRRAIERPSVALGLILGLGFSILALTRPFEGLLVSLPAAAVLLYRMLVGDGRSMGLFLKVTVGAGVVVGGMLAFSAYYNYRVTGEPETMPYSVYQEQYAITPSFLWGSPPPAPEYRHASIEKFYQVWGVQRFEMYRQPQTFLKFSALKIVRILLFYFGPGIVLLIFLPRALRDRWIRFAALVWAGLLLASLTTMGSYPHYLAPATGLYFVVLGACMMAMHRGARNQAAGLRKSALVLGAFGAYAFTGLQPFGEVPEWAEQRAAIEERLSQQPGSDLVVVRYGPEHDVHQEWIYNDASIEESEVIWARDMGRTSNKRLMREFPDRNVWLLRPDAAEVELEEIRSAR